MRKIILLLFLFSAAYVSAQKVFEDTIRIPQVSVHAYEPVEKPMLQTLDSSILHQATQRNLGEVLAQNSNVFIKSYGIGSQATVSLRGSGSAHTAVLWNGMALNSAMNGVVDLSLYPALFVDEVNVSYGNTSLNATSGGIGGAIQLNNKLEFKKKNSIAIQQDLGSYGYQTTSLKQEIGNGKLQAVSKLFFRQSDNNFSYKDLGEEGFPIKEVENAFLVQKSFMQSIAYRLKEKHILEAHYWYYRSDRNLPPVITLRNINEKQEDESNRFLLKMKSYWQDGHYAVNFSLLNDKIVYENNGLLEPSVSNTNSYRSWAEAEKKIKKTTIYARLNGDIEEAEHASFAANIQRERVSFFSSIKHDLNKKIKLELAARQEWILEEDNFFLPLVALNYALHPKLNLNVQWSKNLKYPSLNDLYWENGGNEELEAEENQSIEAGFHLKSSGKESLFHYELRGTAYYSEIENYIQWKPTALGFWQAVNLRNVKVRGIESSMQIAQNKAVLSKQLRASYTYTQSLNQGKIHRFDESDQKQLIYIPEHQFNLYSALKFKSYQLFYQWQFISARYTTTDNSEWQPHYQLSNTGISKQIKTKKHKVNAEFSVLNLFGLEYYAIQWRPMPNRNYQISLTYQFN